MKTIIIAGKPYQLSAEVEAFLRAYLTRVRDFVTIHKLDPDLIFDIEQSIAEKLDLLHAKKKSISEKEAIRIVNDLGEPNDIFQDLISEKSQTEQFVDDMRAQTITLWDKTLGKPKKIFLGVALKLAQKSEIAVGLVRLIIILFLFIPETFFFVLIFYFGAYFFLKDRTGKKSADANIIADFFREIVRFVERVLKWSFGTIRWIFRLIYTLFIAAWKLMGGFLRFVFFAFLGLVFAGLLVTGMLLGPLAFVSLTIANQEIFAHVPEFTKWFALAMTIAAAVLAIWAIGKAFAVRAVSRFVAIVAFIVFVGGTFGLIGAGYQTATHYLNRYHDTIAQPIEVPDREILTISGLDQLVSDGRDQSLLRLPTAAPQVKVTTLVSGEPRIEVRRQISAASQADADELLQKVTPIQIVQDGGQIRFSRLGEQLFSEAVPFTIIQYDIEVFLPQSASLRFSDTPRSFILKNVHSQDDEIWGIFCHDELIFFDAVKGRFVCDSPSSRSL